MNDPLKDGLSSLTHNNDELEKLKNLTQIIYLLQALNFVIPAFAMIAAVVLNYIKLEDVEGTWLESHFRWQIRTFWFALLWGIIASITAWILIGGAIFFVLAVWLIYRIARGWLSLNNGKEMYR